MSEETEWTYHSQKILFQLVERNGGIDHYCNTQSKKSKSDQETCRLLNHHPAVFGTRGSSERKQARRLLHYWYNHYYKRGRFKELCAKFSETPYIQSVGPQTSTQTFVNASPPVKTSASPVAEPSASPTAKPSTAEPPAKSSTLL